MLARLILASTSPYRQRLLERLGVVFQTVAPNVDEERAVGEGPQALVQRLSEAKARSVMAKFPGSLIIGSDQVASLGGEFLGKPGSHAAAVAQLRRSSGQKVDFFTGLCLLDAHTQRMQTAVVPFRVVFRSLTESRIERYLRREKPYDCAGSFKSEGLGIILFEKMQGDDPSALMGLPLMTLVSMFERIGLDVVG